MKESEPNRVTWIEKLLKHPVAINLIVLFVLLLSFMAVKNIHREIVPQIEFDFVLISIPLKKASTPELVDRTIVNIVDQKLRYVEGIKDLNGHASSSEAFFWIEIASGYDTDKIKQEIQDALQAVRLPEQALSPKVFKAQNKEVPMKLAVLGDYATDQEIYEASDKVVRDLMNLGIAQNAWIYAPFYRWEMSFAISPETLRAKEITIEEIAQQVQRVVAVQRGGAVHTERTTVSIKSPLQSYDKEEMEEILIRFSNGELLPLKELTVGAIVDARMVSQEGFIEFNGKKAAIISIEKMKNEDTIALCQAVRKFTEEYELSDGLQIEIVKDDSSIIVERLDMVKSNGLMGLLLLLCCLALFLNWRIAFWTACGVAFALSGSLAALYYMGYTLNWLSLCGFLVVLGIVVDDAIVIGEEFYHKMQQGLSSKQAIVEAMKEISWPVIAMVSTTVVAFLPFFFLEGPLGKWLSIMPPVIIAALLLSLFEALVILPVHLALHHDEKKSSFLRLVSFLFAPFISFSEKVQPKTDALLSWFCSERLRPAVVACVKHRYATSLFFVALLISVFTLIPAGVVKLNFFPKGDPISEVANLQFEEGSMKVEEGARAAEVALQQTRDFFIEKDGTDPVKQTILNVANSSENEASVRAYFALAEEGRKVSVETFLDKWRSLLPQISELESFSFGPNKQGKGWKDLSFRLFSTDSSALDKASKALKSALKSTKNIVDIASFPHPTALAVQVRLKNAYRDSGITEAEIIDTILSQQAGTSIDSFYYGPHEIQLVAKVPQNKEQSIFDLEQLRLKNGMLIGQVAELSLQREASSLQRINGRRSITINASVDTSAGGNAKEIMASLDKGFFKELERDYPMVDRELSGRMYEGNKMAKEMSVTFIPVLFIIYFILALIFRSYLQPIIIMLAIPFGMIGVVIGHWIMGLPLSLDSGFGIISLAGIAVNDSLVLIDCINSMKSSSLPLVDRLAQASVRRFRPILLTSLTTICGMLPLLFETSFQAQQIIPIITSLVFGIAFSTAMIPFLIPCAYAILEDIKQKVAFSALRE